MTAQRSIREWQQFVENCLDCCPDDGVYQMAREMFTDEALFDLEMELTFEKQWIFACHESQIPNTNDFITMQAGRQPMIIARDGKGAWPCRCPGMRRARTRGSVRRGGAGPCRRAWRPWFRGPARRQRFPGRLVQLGLAVGHYADDNI